MKRTLKLTLALLLFTVLGATQVSAWSDPGHMAVAYLAYKNLDTTTRTRVDNLIKLNPKYNEWVSWLPHGTPANMKNVMLFMIAATWADQIKSDGEHHPDGSDPQGNHPPPGPSAGANIGYQDTAMHKYWHYIDEPFSTDGTPLTPPESPNALTQLAVFRAVLRDPNAAPQLKSYDLVWLMHIVGDLHQPLHATARFNHQSPEGDAGGNLVTACVSHCGTLHSFWDGLLGSQNQPNPNTVISIANGLPAAPSALAADLMVEHWINESFSLAKQNVYKSPVGPGKGPFTITPGYQSNATNIARKQVALAGARLANLLKTELK